MSDRIGRLNKALEGRYSIERELGEGGMSTVYLARDLKHDRNVAIKVLRPDIATSIGPERFTREIQIASRLSHPHVLTLFDSGNADGFLFYTMPFVAGESLREHLSRTGRLGVDEAVSIARGVASALTYAHEQGVIHRDVKPGNILLTGKHAFVADFGIARAVEVAGGDRLTGTGFAVGTPAYMSPEQAAGERDVDGRSDVYALGCVLYEMVSGSPPFTGRMQAILAGHLSIHPQSMRASLPDVPLFFERAVERTLAKDPGDRFATPDELIEVLDAQTVVERVGRRRVAVLPPANLSGDQRQEPFVLGLHETLISQLGKGNVAVLGRTSVLQFDRTDTPAREIARQLSVDAVMESSFLQAGDAVQVEVRLVDGHSEEGLWSGSYEGAADDIAGLYRDVGESIAGEVDVVLTPATGSPAKRPVLDPTAYENYMRGRVHQERFTPEDFNLAQGYFEAVLETHPDHAPSHAGLALVLGSKVVLGLAPPLEAGPRWKAEALRAVELDPALGEAHQALAQGYAWFEWDWELAEREFLKALELDPSDVQALIFYSHFLAMMRREAEAIDHARRAVEIDPLNQFLQAMYGIVLFLTRRIEEARDQLETCIASAPSNALARMGMCNCLAVLGELDLLREAQIAYFTSIGDTVVVEALSGTDAEASPRLGLRRAADRLVERSRHMYVKTMSFVTLYDQAGETELAIKWMHRARELADHEMAYLSVLPFSVELHGHPEVLEMLHELKLPPPPPPVVPA